MISVQINLEDPPTQAEFFKALISHWTLGLIQERGILTGQQQSELFTEVRRNGNFYEGDDPKQQALASVMIRSEALKLILRRGWVTRHAAALLRRKVRNVLNLYSQDAEFAANHIVAIMNGTIVGDHKIEFDRAGFNGSIGRFTCMTCGSTLLDNSTPVRERNKKKFEFFKAHPYRKIEDIGYQV